MHFSASTDMVLDFFPHGVQNSPNCDKLSNVVTLVDVDVHAQGMCNQIQGNVNVRVKFVAILTESSGIFLPRGQL